MLQTKMAQVFGFWVIAHHSTFQRSLQLRQTKQTAQYAGGRLTVFFVGAALSRRARAAAAPRHH